MKRRQRTLDELADMICGNGEGAPFVYRSSSYITRFFRDADTEFAHDGSTRAAWVSGVIEQILTEPHADAQTPPATFCRVIATLMDIGDATDGDPDRAAALTKLNTAIAREGFEAFYAPDRICYLRHIGTGAIAVSAANPHRPFSSDELARRELLAAYLNEASEDELIEEVLLPLFRQLGFHRVTAVGHKDKALEYGKDIWMRYKLPTQHVLYFGLQAKRDKLDAAGMSKAGTANVSEILNQVTMMLGHEIFDSETSRRVLIDHAFIVAGGVITKAAKNWLGERLDASKRSQVMFMDRDTSSTCLSSPMSLCLLQLYRRLRQVFSKLTFRFRRSPKKTLSRVLVASAAKSGERGSPNRMPRRSNAGKGRRPLRPPRPASMRSLALTYRRRHAAKNSKTA